MKNTLSKSDLWQKFKSKCTLCMKVDYSILLQAFFITLLTGFILPAFFVENSVNNLNVFIERLFSILTRGSLLLTTIVLLFTLLSSAWRKILLKINYPEEPDSTYSVGNFFNFCILTAFFISIVLNCLIQKIHNFNFFFTFIELILYLYALYANAHIVWISNNLDTYTQNIIQKQEESVKDPLINKLSSEKLQDTEKFGNKKA